MCSGGDGTGLWSLNPDPHTQLGEGSREGGGLEEVIREGFGSRDMGKYKMACCDGQVARWRGGEQAQLLRGRPLHQHSQRCRLGHTFQGFL